MVIGLHLRLWLLLTGAIAFPLGSLGPSIAVEWPLRAGVAKRGWSRVLTNSQTVSGDRHPELALLSEAMHSYKYRPHEVAVATSGQRRSRATSQLQAQVAWVLGPEAPALVESARPLSSLPSCIIKPAREAAWLFRIRSDYEEVVESASWSVFSRVSR